MALLVFGAILGVPVATAAYFFLKGVDEAQHYLYATLPGELGFNGEPIWWPLPLLALSGLLVALAIRYLPGTGGHSPADGFKPSGPVPPIELPGIIIAAFATLSLGAVLGPEAPLIAIGSGIGVLAVHLIKRDAPAQATMVIGAAGSFAAISTLLGSPIVGAFLMMEVSGLGGPLLGVVLVPGLLAAGVGSLIFVGLDAWTGFGTFSLAVPDIPPFGTPDGAEFLWALAIGVAAAGLGTAIRMLALLLRPIVERRSVLLTPVVGLAVGGLAIAFAEGSDRSSSEVLFSGQDRASVAHPERRNLDSRRPRAARRVQRPRLQRLLEQLPRWPHLPRHVPRRSGRNRPVAPSRVTDDCGRRDGYRGNDSGDARSAADRGLDRHSVSPGRRSRTHAARDRRRRSFLRHLGTASARPGMGRRRGARWRSPSRRDGSGRHDGGQPSRGGASARAWSAFAPPTASGSCWC